MASLLNTRVAAVDMCSYTKAAIVCAYLGDRCFVTVGQYIADYKELNVTVAEMVETVAIVAGASEQLGGAIADLLPHTDKAIWELGAAYDMYAWQRWYAARSATMMAENAGIQDTQIVAAIRRCLDKEVPEDASNRDTAE